MLWDHNHWSFLVFVLVSLSGWIRRSATKMTKGKRTMRPMNRFLISWGASLAANCQIFTLSVKWAAKLTFSGLGTGGRAKFFFLFLFVHTLSLPYIIGQVSWSEKFEEILLPGLLPGDSPLPISSVLPPPGPSLTLEICSFEAGEGGKDSCKKKWWQSEADSSLEEYPSRNVKDTWSAWEQAWWEAATMTNRNNPIIPRQLASHTHMLSLSQYSCKMLEKFTKHLC